MKRLKKVTVRLSESEYIHLKEQSFITGFKLEPFIRSLIAGCNLKPSPPDSYKDLVRELSAIGNNINQITRLANRAGSVSTAQAEQLSRLMREVWTKIQEYA